METKAYHIINTIIIIFIFGMIGLTYLFNGPELLGIIMFIWPVFMIMSFRKTNVDNEHYRKSAVWSIWALISIIPTAYLGLTLSNLLNKNVEIVAVIPAGLIITSLVFFIIGYYKNKI